VRAGVLMRTIFAVYVLLIVAGLVYFTLLGLWSL
jgi:hypothetical protein